jgi:hypothetical protein
MVQFWNGNVLMLQVCLLARILILSGNTTKPVKIKKDKIEGFMKIHFHSKWRVQLQGFLGE